MWRLTYNLLVLSALPFFVLFSLTKKKIRANLAERLFPEALEAGVENRVWVHSASLGEAVIAENLMTYLRRTVTNPFLVTTNTYYARDLLRKKLGDSAVIRSLPIDLPWSIERFMGRSSFAALLLVETEIWPNLIWIAKGRRMPVIIVNGRISDRTIGRYRLLAFFVGKVLASVDFVLAQSEEHARRFVSLGMAASKVVNTGNLKYFREIGGTADEAEGKDAVTFGSLKEKELPIVFPVIDEVKRRFPELTVFVAPRELSLVPAMERGLSERHKVARYSAMKENRSEGGDVVLVDTVGDLVSLYARSMAAFVGGSLAPYGGQNVLEPLFVGTPVLFGPYVDNFREPAEEIIASGAGFQVRDGDDLLAAMTRVLADPEIRLGLAKAGKSVLEKQRGAMEKAASLISEIVWKNSRSSSV
jgi:3-deoxy-D-manno-octulosonic-acid transferase